MVCDLFCSFFFFLFFFIYKIGQINLAVPESLASDLLVDVHLPDPVSLGPLFHGVATPPLQGLSAIFVFIKQ